MNYLNIVNLTPHDITLIQDGKEIPFDSEGLARVSQIINKEESIENTIPITSNTFGEVLGLPPTQPLWKVIDNQGVCADNPYPLFFETSEEAIESGYHNPIKGILTDYYIVSFMVKSASPGRKDLLVPNELVRNEKGIIIGCKSFSQ
jgi:hypothetical protein